MNTVPQLAPGRLALLIDPDTLPMQALTAQLALRGRLQFIDGGNRFAAYHIARQVRRHTPHLAAVLDQISVARAFTCYQVVRLLAQTPVTAVPVLVCDLLATFADESVSLAESRRLLRLAIRHLQRLSQQAPVLVSLHASVQPERAALTAMLLKTADTVHQRLPATPPQPPLRFQFMDGE